jgi:hypothetical protein
MPVIYWTNRRERVIKALLTGRGAATADATLSVKEPIPIVADAEAAGRGDAKADLIVPVITADTTGRGAATADATVSIKQPAQIVGEAVAAGRGDAKADLIVPVITADTTGRGNGSAIAWVRLVSESRRFDRLRRMQATHLWSSAARD